jgi:hypothetical protein
VGNGVAARMALYDYDFVPGTDQLNYRGRDRLRQIAFHIPRNPFPVVVERLPFAPALADARRLAVLNELAAAGLQAQVGSSSLADRVVVSGPIAVPLRGIEAISISQNLDRISEWAGVWVNQDLQTDGRPQVGPILGSQGGAGGGGGPGSGAAAPGPGLGPR